MTGSSSVLRQACSDPRSATLSGPASVEITSILSRAEHHATNNLGAHLGLGLGTAVHHGGLPEALQ